MKYLLSILVLISSVSTLALDQVPDCWTDSSKYAVGEYLLTLPKSAEKSNVREFSLVIRNQLFAAYVPRPGNRDYFKVLLQTIDSNHPNSTKDEKRNAAENLLKNLPSLGVGISCNLY